MTRFIKPILSAIVLTIGLSSCIPAALMIGATAGGAIVYDKRSSKTMVQDQEAAETAGERLMNAPSLIHGTHLVAAAFNHVLLIAGQTETAAQRDTAGQVVANIRNVSRVYNEITVEKPTSTWQRSHDGWITTKVKTEMLATSGLHSTQIKVVTENSTVYLMGLVTEQQANLAVDVARHVTGVHKVVKVFERPQ